MCLMRAMNSSFQRLQRFNHRGTEVTENLLVFFSVPSAPLWLTLNRAPDPLRGRRHFDVGNAELGQRIDYRVDDDPERRGRAAFAGRPDPERMGRAWHLAEFGVEERHHVGLRHRVIHERAGQYLCAAGLVDALLPQRLPDPLDDAAMHLAMHDHRIDRPPAIIDCGVAHDLDNSGIGVDLDLADMAAIGEGGEVDGLIAHALQWAAQILRQIGPLQPSARDLEDPDGAVGALDLEPPAGERDVLDRRLQHMAGDAQPLLDDLVRGVEHDDAAEPQRPAGMRAAADRDAVGVAGDQLDAVDRHAEPFGDQLREAGLVALALRRGADHNLDGAAHRAIRLHRDLGLLARRAGRGVDVIGDADAAALAL